ncbi:MAG: DNA primase [Christensenellales bacterium]
MAYFPDAWLEELLEKSDFAAIASEYVQLKPRGGRLWGCCPFHHEKTPSFSVSPDKQMFYCFGCKKGGSLISFVMDMEKVSFVDAVRQLAERAGMELPEQADDRGLSKNREKKERMYSAYREAGLFYHHCLKQPMGREACEYLARRGVAAETAAAFGLGWAPAGWEGELFRHLTAKGYSPELLVEAGLCSRSKKDESKYFDWFRGRLVFPIIGTYNRLIGFGARALGAEQPKYLNSPETPIFNKRRNLFGFNRLKGKNPGKIILVEGYMDVISLFGHGVTNAVASLGTALTREQARLLKNTVSEVLLAYDGDFAGQKATVEALNTLEAAGLNARVILLPAGMDPDDFLRSKGIEAFRALCETAVSGNSFRLIYLKSKYDLNTDDGRTAFARAASRLIVQFSPIEQERYLAELSGMTGFSREALTKEAQMAGIRQMQKNTVTNYRNTRKNAVAMPPGGENRRRNAECLLLRLAIDDAAYIPRVQEKAELIRGEGARALLGALKDLPRNDPDALSVFVNRMDQAASSCYAECMSMPPCTDFEICFSDCVSELMRMDREAKIEQLLKQAEDPSTTKEQRAELLQRIGELRGKNDEAEGRGYEG